jgi:hypothetical protein
MPFSVQLHDIDEWATGTARLRISSVAETSVENQGIPYRDGSRGSCIRLRRRALGRRTHLSADLTSPVRGEGVATNGTLGERERQPERRRLDAGEGCREAQELHHAGSGNEGVECDDARLRLDGALDVPCPNFGIAVLGGERLDPQCVRIKMAPAAKARSPRPDDNDAPSVSDDRSGRIDAERCTKIDDGNEVPVGESV